MDLYALYTLFMDQDCVDNECFAICSYPCQNALQSHRPFDSMYDLKVLNLQINELQLKNANGG